MLNYPTLTQFFFHFTTCATSTIVSEIQHYKNTFANAPFSPWPTTYPLITKENTGQQLAQKYYVLNARSTTSIIHELKSEKNNTVQDNLW